MSPQPPGGEQDPAPEDAAVRRRRLAEVFGEVLPEQTRDDLAEPGAGSDDDWWRQQVPPHHG